MKSASSATTLLLLAALELAAAEPAPAAGAVSAAKLAARVGPEAVEAYRASSFSELSRNYFSRFSRDPAARPNENETIIEKDWRIIISSNATPLTELMAGHLAEFLRDGMKLDLPIEKAPAPSRLGQLPEKAVVLLESGGGREDTPESFTITVEAGRVFLRGRDDRGLRDAIVRLADRVGLRQAPMLERGEQVCLPRLAVRLGAVPWLGSYRELVFLGYNAVFVSGGSLYALSTSEAIPELKSRADPHALSNLVVSARAARRYGLRPFAFIDTRQKFPKDHPVFAAHPEIRGALTWKADGEYTLCTEHPLVRRWLAESIEGLFRAEPQLEGVMFIIGGEGFYHCFMRPFGVAKGHTGCPRCEALGPNTVVANLCNHLAAAARRINPAAQAIAWPYSAEHVWSSDRAQSGLIAQLKPGTALFTEIEKDEYIEKPEGVRKHAWDYSIDLIGPGERARQQVRLCRNAGLPVYLKSEPELGFEAPRLSHIPCLDRWADRAEALASSGASGAFVFPAFRACYGTSAAEVNKFFWWQPAPDRETTLSRFADRLVGKAAGPHLRAAWRQVSAAIPWSPELPSYYTGPYYLGPAHPMCADPSAPVPDIFSGYYLFMAEMTDAEGLKARPTFVRSPTGNVPVFGRFYRKMEDHLRQAVAALEAAAPLVPPRCQLMFEAEASATRWFYHTARTEANFYESCQIRDRLLALAPGSLSAAQGQEAGQQLARWRQLLEDEQHNAEQALPVAEADVRLDCYYGGDHTFSHTADMLRAKLKLLEQETKEWLPVLARRLGLAYPPP
jgi:hypothetical protein